jgi:hypothetical protein
MKFMGDTITEPVRRRLRLLPNHAMDRIGRERRLAPGDGDVI